MNRRSQLGCACLLASQLAACAAHDDIVFTPIRLGFVEQELGIMEGAGLVTVSLRLSAAPRETVSVSYEIAGVDAQDVCPERDFEGQVGSLSWAPGQTEASLSLLVADDELAETSERLVIRLGAPTGAVLDGPSELTLLIDDDDRTELIDAALDFGVLPGSQEDAGPALQAALDAAAESGRGVVVVAPGDYQIGAVRVAAGTTLSGRGASFHRPAFSAPETKSFLVDYSGNEDSLPTLIEGISIDGARDSQGEFRQFELFEGHLLRIQGDAEQAGRARATVEGVSLQSGTGDGIALGPNTDVTVCAVTGHDLWRELLSTDGGNIRVRAEHVVATSTEGTTGMWFRSAPTGFGQSSVVDIELSDVQLSSGDLELVLAGGSSFVARGLTMKQAPFRLTAEDSTVRISDSVLTMGVPSRTKNYFRVPHDVEIRDTILLLSERTEEDLVSLEADRSLVFAAVSFSASADGPVVPGIHRLLFDRCQFLLGPDIESSDQVHVASAVAGGSVIVQNSSMGSGIEGWFAESCFDCKLIP